MSNQHVHKRLVHTQIETIFENYLAKEITLVHAMENLGLKRTQFFAWLQRYKEKPEAFCIAPAPRAARHVIGAEAEQRILTELEEEKKLIDNPDIPVRTYNYAAIADTLKDKYGIEVSDTTVVNRAKKYGHYLPRPEKKIHDREVLTNCIGELIQHDSSHHLWSPYMAEKLYLVTSLDDHSRMLLFADFFLRETAWIHILALKSVFLQYGCALKYYPDQHSIFRYVHDRDKHNPWHAYSKFTDEVVTQWGLVLEACNVDVSYALSPQAKGKVERPYRWLQDRVVRIAAREHLTTVEELRKVLYGLVEKYNTKWVHSTTGEIPVLRFEKAVDDRRTLFKPFQLLHPGQDVKDVFCLRDRRIVDAYRRISWEGIELSVPNGMPKETVDLKIVPDMGKNIIEVRFWQGNRFLGSQHVPTTTIKKVWF